MRLIATILTALALTASASARTASPAAPRPLEGAINGHPGWPQPRTSDVDSIDHILAALYDVISGPAGQQRDWNRFRSLFVPGARLIPIHVTPGSPDPKTQPATDVYFLSVEDYVARASARMESEGFFERGIRNQIDQFGSLVSVFSTYESRHALADSKPFSRGINSIQLLKDGGRYWVIDIAWDAERPGSTIPPRYLPSAGKNRQSGQNGQSDQREADAEAVSNLDSERPARLFAGNWTGHLSNPSQSNPGVGAAGVSLNITPSSDGRAMTFALTYEAGVAHQPAERTMITLFPRTGSATIMNLDDHTSQSYTLSGYPAFARNQGGDLTLTGSTNENGKPVDVRIAFNLTAGSLTWRRAVRPAGTTEDYVLRHDFTFTRASTSPPANTPE
jgi:hypothetical protein